MLIACQAIPVSFSEFFLMNTSAETSIFPRLNQNRVTTLTP